MADITVAADEVAATELLHDAEVTLGQISRSGGPNSLGPFSANWNASAFFAGGRVDLTPPNLIGLAECEMHYNLHFNFSLNLNNVAPPFYLQPPPITIGWGKWKITITFPKVHIPWPTINIPVGHSGVVMFTADFKFRVYLLAGYWHIDAEINSVPNLQIDLAASGILAAIGVAAFAVLSPIPFIGPFLGGAVATITSTIALAGIKGFLGPILTLFLSGLTFPLYKQPRIFTVLPPGPDPFMDPEVKIRLDEVRASVNRTDEDELVIQLYIS